MSEQEAAERIDPQMALIHSLTEQNLRLTKAILVLLEPGRINGDIAD